MLRNISTTNVRANSTPLQSATSPSVGRRSSLAYGLARGDLSRRSSLASPQEPSIVDQLLQETGNNDRISQLQQSMDQLTSTFSNAVDFLQRRAPLTQVKGSSILVTKVSEFAESEESFSQQSKSYAADISRISKEIETLTNSLPGIDKSEEQQCTLIQKLDHENQESEAKLQLAVKNAEEILELINATLRQVVEGELKIRCGERVENLLMEG